MWKLSAPAMIVPGLVASEPEGSIGQMWSANAASTPSNAPVGGVIKCRTILLPLASNFWLGWNTPSSTALCLKLWIKLEHPLQSRTLPYFLYYESHQVPSQHDLNRPCPSKVLSEARCRDSRTRPLLVHRFNQTTLMHHHAQNQNEITF
eukprot:1161481-Pelagomonas_calceolata.AAC.2